MSEPLWLQQARADIGMSELAGAPTAPKIDEWLKKLGAWWRDDETPWCGTAVAAWMTNAGAGIPKHWYRAKGWLDWGQTLSTPVVGCVVVFEREGGGHVGLCVGRDAAGHLMVLGGNQGNKVSIAPFLSDRVIGYRWPSDMEPVMMAGLPTLLASGEPVSTNEA